MEQSNTIDIREKLRQVIKKAQGESTGNTGGIPYSTKLDLQSTLHTEGAHFKEIAYNEQQLEAIDTIYSGTSCVVTGAAGSGKTTTIEGAIDKLSRLDSIGKLSVSNHKWLRAESISIVCISFTNKAVQNMKKSLPRNLHNNCMTAHKLLEFAPVFYEVYDEETGVEYTTMKFLPTRNVENPLPPISVLIIDEAPMLPVDLWNLIADAIVGDMQVILIGDIHQLPPVFGKSIFIWAMQLGAKTIELTHIYRQALESPIISLATRVRSGKQILPKDIPSFIQTTNKGKVNIICWQKKYTWEVALSYVNLKLTELIDAGEYDPMEDVVLTPFNKSFGTVAMNVAVASHLVKKETDPQRQEVWEIYAGVNKKYLRIGDKVLVNKSEAIITKIEKNLAYYGKKPRPPSDTMNYNGLESDPEKRFLAASSNTFDLDSEEEVDNLLAHMESHTHEADKVSREASHKITVYIPDLELTETLTSSGAINAMDLAYALTVHKSQGSEYNRVLFITHGSQRNMWYRELLYTGITRAAKELYIICEPTFFMQGVSTQRIPGDTLQDKIANFDRSISNSKQGQHERPKKAHLLLPSK